MVPEEVLFGLFLMVVEAQASVLSGEPFFPGVDDGWLIVDESPEAFAAVLAADLDVAATIEQVDDVIERLYRGVAASLVVDGPIGPDEFDEKFGVGVGLLGAIATAADTAMTAAQERITASA